MGRPPATKSAMQSAVPSRFFFGDYILPPSCHRIQFGEPCGAPCSFTSVDRGHWRRNLADVVGLQSAATHGRGPTMFICPCDV